MLINPWDKPTSSKKARQCSGKVFMSLTRFYFNYTYDEYETGRILIQGEDILFIPDISWGRAYYIKNKSAFKELDKRRISACGKLKNYSEFDIKEFKVIE